MANMARAKRRKLAQTCSGCGYNGHNRRRCPDQTDVLSSKTTNGPIVDVSDVSFDTDVNETTSTSAPTAPPVIKRPHAIPVHHVPHALSSPHVVSLTQKHRERAKYVSSVPVYEEKPVALPRRSSVSFGELVAAFQKSPSTPRVSPSKTLVVRQRLSLAARVRQASERFRTSVGNVIADVAGMNARRAVSIALVLITILSLPMPAVGYYGHLKSVSATATSEGTQAFISLLSSTKSAFSGSLPDAKAQLSTALASFAAVDQSFGPPEKVLLAIARYIPVIGSGIESRERLLSAGHHVAIGNAYLLQGIDSATQEETASLTTRLLTLNQHLVAGIPEYQAALADLEHVDPAALPQEYQSSFADVRVLFSAFVHDLTDVSHLADATAAIFGSNDFRRYLVVFQNSNELRPTGGFVGSIAVVDVQKGKIITIDVPGGGPYDLSGQLSVSVAPPVPLQILNKRWEFQDANWFPDFSASAKKLSWFYQKSRGATVDGVIAVNASVLERVLAVLGPVTLERYGKTFDAATGIETLQSYVEHEYDKTDNTPKAIVGDLLNEIMARQQTLSGKELAALVGVFHDALTSKDIQIYTQDRETQATLASFGWTGEMMSTGPQQDYLSVNVANIRSQKTDAVITEDISHQAVVSEDGAITDTVIIRRTHHGDKGRALTGGPNISFVRVYVPEGATLLDAGGFSYPAEDAFRVPEKWYTDDADLHASETEVGVDQKTGTRVTREFGKTAFGNWMQVTPGETVEAYVVYRLPFRLSLNEEKQSKLPVVLSSVLHTDDPLAARYTALFQKQSGITARMKSSIIFPDGWRPVWKSGSDVALAQNGATIQGPLDRDWVVGIAMSRQ